MKDITKSIIIASVSGVIISLAVGEIHDWRQRHKRH